MKFELKNVTKKFDDKTALDDITINSESGQILAIVGPSGSGKTTLLRLINLLDTPSSGAIMLNDKKCATLKGSELYDLQTKMALVFQNPSLFQRSVEVNVGYSLKIRMVHPDRIREEVKKALTLVGLNDLKHQFAPTLSAGEAQRVSFARAIVFLPELLLMDEFTANLKLLEKAVTRYREETKATIVLATHNIFQAKRLADDVAFLYDGRIVETAEKNDFFEDPKDPLTKAFLSGELIC